MQFFVSASKTQKLLVSAGFDNMPPLKNDNCVCILDRAEAMRNGKNSAVLHHFVQGILNQFLRYGVQ